MKNLIMNIILSASSILLVVSSAHSAIFTLDLLASTTKVHKPKVYSLGDIVLKNGVKISAYNATYSADWSSQDFEISIPESLAINKVISEEIANELALYFIANQWLLVPKDWQLNLATEGANGSQLISFSPPRGQNGEFLYDSAGACYGCGVHLASPFFKQADLINQQDYNSKSNHRSNLRFINIRPNTKAWRYNDKGKNIDGLIYWNTDGDISIAEHIQISLPKSQQHLATPVLNWWLPNRK